MFIDGIYYNILIQHKGMDHIKLICLSYCLISSSKIRKIFKKLNLHNTSYSILLMWPVAAYVRVFGPWFNEQY